MSPVIPPPAFPAVRASARISRSTCFRRISDPTVPMTTASSAIPISARTSRPGRPGLVDGSMPLFTIVIRPGSTPCAA